MLLDGEGEYHSKEIPLEKGDLLLLYTDGLAEVRKKSSALNVSTVYRTLEVLEQLGLVRHAHLSDRAPTYHSVRDHEHFHLVCRNCHKVISVHPQVLEPTLTRLREEFAFEVDIGHLTVFGRCTDCQGEP